MSDTIAGDLHVANDVLVELVCKAALECYGVIGLTAPTSVQGNAKILPESRLQRGVLITPSDTGIKVELYVIIEYGTNINTVSQNLIDQVTFMLTEYVGVSIDSVEVHVQGVKVRK